MSMPYFSSNLRLDGIFTLGPGCGGTWSQFYGGVLKSKDDTSVFSRVSRLEDKLVLIKDMQSKEAIELWDKFGNDLVLSNQYYYSFAPKFALASNQDFSKTQFTPGLAVDLSAKAWKKIVRYRILMFLIVHLQC